VFGKQALYIQGTLYGVVAFHPCIVCSLKITGCNKPETLSLKIIYFMVYN
jgi:hypothetical protein